MTRSSISDVGIERSPAVRTTVFQNTRIRVRRMVGQASAVEKMPIRKIRVHRGKLVESDRLRYRWNVCSRDGYAGRDKVGVV